SAAGDRGYRRGAARADRCADRGSLAQGQGGRTGGAAVGRCGRRRAGAAGKDAAAQSRRAEKHQTASSCGGGTRRRRRLGRRLTMAVSANRLELLQIADAVAREKTIDRGIVIAAMEDAIAKAARAR